MTLKREGPLYYLNKCKLPCVSHKLGDLRKFYFSDRLKTYNPEYKMCMLSGS